MQYSIMGETEKYNFTQNYKWRSRFDGIQG
jgi:hypothetical protein